MAISIDLIGDVTVTYGISISEALRICAVVDSVLAFAAVKQNEVWWLDSLNLVDDMMERGTSLDLGF